MPEDWIRALVADFGNTTMRDRRAAVHARSRRPAVRRPEHRPRSARTTHARAPSRHRIPCTPAPSVAAGHPPGVPVPEVRSWTQSVAAAEVARPHLPAARAGDHRAVKGSASNLGDDERAGEPARREVLLAGSVLSADRSLGRGPKWPRVREGEGVVTPATNVGAARPHAPPDRCRAADPTTATWWVRSPAAWPTLPP